MNIRILAAALVLAAAPVFAAGPMGVPPGYRGVSLSLPAHQLRFIDAGDRVDILTTFEAMLGGKQAVKEDVTATIMQNVIVLAIDKKEGVVQFAFNPNEAQYTALFASTGKGHLWLSKRAAGDTEMHPMEMASARKLFR